MIFAKKFQIHNKIQKINLLMNRFKVNESLNESLNCVLSQQDKLSSPGSSTARSLDGVTMDFSREDGMPASTSDLLQRLGPASEISFVRVHRNMFR